MESINTRSSNGKIQDTVRENIKKAAYDECYDIIYKIRKQMDTDYNTLEKQLDELGESCEGLVDKFKDQVQKIVNVQNFMDIDSLSAELKTRFTTLGKNKSEKILYLKERIACEDLLDLLGQKEDKTQSGPSMEGDDTQARHDKLIEVFECIVKQYMANGFVQI